MARERKDSEVVIWRLTWISITRKGQHAKATMGISERNTIELSLNTRVHTIPSYQLPSIFDLATCELRPKNDNIRKKNKLLDTTH